MASKRAGVAEKAKRAKEAALRLSSASAKERNDALRAIASALHRERKRIRKENDKDIYLAKKEGIGSALRERLLLDDKKIDGLIRGIHDVGRLPDPLGRTLKAVELDRGLEIYQVSCPLGVIGVIFESRPDALVQISTLCLKSGNAVLLKGGREASHTNAILFSIIEKATEQAGMPGGWLQLLETREDVKGMLALHGEIDLLIPRGSNAFVRFVMEHTRIPVLGHSGGICHIYVDRDANMGMAVDVVTDAKCDYPAACNTMETLLVHKGISGEFLKKAGERLKEGRVELRGDKATRKIITAKKATAEDWDMEYNDLVVSIKVVGNVDEAIRHINRYGSRHTDAIITQNRGAARKFLEEVDSANVFWNCSTRFADGYRYGLGAEVGISTSKLHARGPVGMEGLVSYKWKLLGHGQVVADYAGKRKYSHRILKKAFPLGKG